MTANIWMDTTTSFDSGLAPKKPNMPPIISLDQERTMIETIVARAPPTMKGRLFPYLLRHRSLLMPTYGCTSTPESGPAIHTRARIALSSPRDNKNGCKQLIKRLLRCNQCRQAYGSVGHFDRPSHLKAKPQGQWAIGETEVGLATHPNPPSVNRNMYQLDLEACSSPDHVGSSSLNGDMDFTGLPNPVKSPSRDILVGGRSGDCSSASSRSWRSLEALESLADCFKVGLDEESLARAGVVGGDRLEIGAAELVAVAISGAWRYISIFSSLFYASTVCTCIMRRVSVAGTRLKPKNCASGKE
jgi:hypothetical protein